MSDYHVVWEIDVSAESPELAARLAQEFQRDLDSEVGVFDVYVGDSNQSIRVDLNPVTRYYTSADVTDDGPWSVYSETYPDKYSDEPVDGSQEFVVSAPNQHTADLIAKALYDQQIAAESTR